MIRKVFILMLVIALPVVILGAALKTGAGPAPTLSAASTVGTGFTYQGYLESGESPVNSTCDFQFSLYDAAASGGQVGSTLAVNSQAVTNGLFTVQLDFGLGVFDGVALWLEIAVRCPAGSGNHATLTPRQALTPSPYAIYATRAGSAPWAGLTGVPADFGDNIDDDTLGSLSCANGELPVWDAPGSQWVCTSNQGAAYSAGTGLDLAGTVFSLDTAYTDGRYWKGTGNSGTTPGTNILGTTDNISLTLVVSSAAALRLVPSATSPNLIGGHNANSVANGIYGATISGGGDSYSANQIGANYAAIGGGYNNIANGEYGSIGGGAGNVISGTLDNGATIAGGASNSASERYTVVGGGSSNQASALLATVSGGGGNIAAGGSTSVGGGDSNTASGQYATVGGGRYNVVSGAYGTIAGGGLWQGLGNRVTDDGGAVGGGSNNQAGDNAGTTNDAPYATVSGGDSNGATSGYATVGGGKMNAADGSYASVGGGHSNTITGTYGTIAGGHLNKALNSETFIGGGTSNQATGQGATVVGGGSNFATNLYAVAVGGSGNYATGINSFVGGGWSNDAQGQQSTVGGGDNNIANGLYSAVVGGNRNYAGGQSSFVGGGHYNFSDANYTSIGGGYTNVVTATYGTIAGGNGNLVRGQYGTVPGGNQNVAGGYGSFAAGENANAAHDHSFVWGDGSGAAYSTAPNQFLALASNGVGFYTGFGSCTFFSGANWTCSSDRNLKENFTEIDPQEILIRLAQVPITRWNMKGQDPDVHHFGPVAQDFYAAFGLGEDGEHINTGDAQGVALAAIQGLYAISQEQAATIATLEAQNANLEARLTALEDALADMPSSETNAGWGQWWPFGLLLIGLVWGQRHRNGGH